MSLTWGSFNAADPLSQADFNITSASCKSNGSIIPKNANTTRFVFSWEDSSGNLLGSSNQILSLSPGNYKLNYTLDGSSTYTINFSVPEVLPNATTQNNLIIACDENSLRVRADRFSSSTIVNFKWEDESGVIIGTNEFINLTAGQYYLTLTDEYGCSSNRASIRIKVASERPLIDQSRAVITSSRCLSPDGSITGLIVSSSDEGPYTYIWRNSAGDQVGDRLDLVGVQAGKYRLTARLTAGLCERISEEIVVNQRNPLISSTSSVVSKSADCELLNGGITGVQTNATSFRWIGVDKKTVAITLDMVNVKEGYYELILSNEFGCQETLGPFHVKAGNPPITMQSMPVIKNDSCNLGIGSILGANVVASGIRYSWADASGREISTDPDLRNVKAGDYLLTIRNSSCSQSYPYTIQNIEIQLPAPVLENKFVCSAAEILISFAETAPLYRIYYENGNLLQESRNRNFIINVKDNVTYYGAIGNGACESVRTAFKVIIGEASIKIPSSFSPNNDGTNDTWILKGIEVYNTADVKIYNRYGVLVYHSCNPANVFDGKRDGNDLPSGVYYYIIKLTNECNPLTGSVTILR
ncbi:MAG: gliding motility-associated C-terminal domain-containing protein [Pedobacter sp.]|nr:gliding motility-associated C-terminal domain-containing protein [Pedobacter sp.]